VATSSKSIKGARKSRAKPDQELEDVVAQAKAITESWAERHDLWGDSGHKDPLDHYDTEPGEGSSILTLWSEGMVGRCLNEGMDEAEELYAALESIGVFIELDDHVTAGYYLIDQESDLQKRFDEWARWRWTCRLIEADTADVSGDIYEYFSKRPDDLYRLSPRAFEELISSVFTARGWRTQIGPGSADEGVDVRMWIQSPLGDALTLVQVKRYAKHRPIDLDAVAALEAHSLREKAGGLFVTTSRYRNVAKRFASRNKDLILADSSDVASWCEEASQEAMKAKARALAMTSLGPLLDEIRSRGTHPALVFSWKSFSYPCFCIVLRETPTGALLLPIPSQATPPDGLVGYVLPVLDGSLVDQTPGNGVFRAIRRESEGRVSYWGSGELYGRWDGKPLRFDLCD